MPDLTTPEFLAVLDRLSRRGQLTVVARDGKVDVRLEPLDAFRSRTTDVADVQEHERLFAKPYRGSGTSLDALLVECEEESRPPRHDVEMIVWLFRRRRAERVYGPPLPSWISWRGWRPGVERWLRTFDHAHEYQAHYRRDVWSAAEDRWRSEQSRRRSEERRRAARADLVTSAEASTGTVSP